MLKGVKSGAKTSKLIPLLPPFSAALSNVVKKGGAKQSKLIPLLKKWSKNISN